MVNFGIVYVILIIWISLFIWIMFFSLIWILGWKLMCCQFKNLPKLTEYWSFCFFICEDVQNVWLRTSIRKSQRNNKILLALDRFNVLLKRWDICLMFYTWPSLFLYLPFITLYLMWKYAFSWGFISTRSIIFLISSSYVFPSIFFSCSFFPACI